jgi:hypothetical protein
LFPDAILGFAGSGATFPLPLRYWHTPIMMLNINILVPAEESEVMDLPSDEISHLWWWWGGYPEK